VALLLGDHSGLDYETETAFKVSGIRHIIAVSGLHVSILFALIYLMAGKNRVLTALIGLPLLGFFAMVAGLSPSVIRACIMHGLMILAMLWDREYDPLTALAFAALVMLIINPIVITDVGFQLSFACMLGILLYATKIKNWLLHEDRLGCAKGNKEGQITF
jgi:competence protein ComEC